MGTVPEGHRTDGSKIYRVVFTVVEKRSFRVLARSPEDAERVFHNLHMLGRIVAKSTQLFSERTSRATATVKKVQAIKDQDSGCVPVDFDVCKATVCEQERRGRREKHNGIPF